MAGQGLGIADIDQTGDELERILEARTARTAALDAKGEDARGAPPPGICPPVVCLYGRAARRN